MSALETDLNPNKISPLTAMLQIKTDKPCSVRVKVLGDIPVEQSLDSLSTDLEVSVLGLYPDKLNRVEVTLDYEGGQKVDVIEIQTEEIPAFFPSIRVNKLEKEYPIIANEFQEILVAQYELFAQKMLSYGMGNISMGSNLETKDEVKFSLTSIWIRMNDKMNRLKNLVLLGLSLIHI